MLPECWMVAIPFAGQLVSILNKVILKPSLGTSRNPLCGSVSFHRKGEISKISLIFVAIPFAGQLVSIEVNELRKTLEWVVSQSPLRVS